MNYKLLALDIDGTLLNPQWILTERVKEAVKKASEAGCIVTLATGRRYRSARHVAAMLGLNAPLIMYCGSVVYDTRNERAIYHQPAPAEFIHKAIQVQRTAGVQPAMLQSPLSGEYIFIGPESHEDEYMRGYATSPIRADLIRRREFAELASVENVLTVSAVGASRTFEKLKLAVEAHNFDCHLFTYPLSHPTLKDLQGFDLIQPGVGKGVALKVLAQHFGLDISQTMAIGDSPNDLDMITVAGLGVAMGNAAPVLKAAAKVQVSSNAEDGVAEAIERYVL